MANERIESVIRKLERGISKSLEIFNTLSSEDWETPISDGSNSWSIKDLVEHFIYSEENMLALAQDIASGGSGAPLEFDIEEFNRQEMGKMSHLNPGQLLRLLEGVRATTVKWVQNLDEGSLDLEGWHPVLGTTNLEGVLTAIYAHQLIHMRETLPRLRRG